MCEACGLFLSSFNSHQVLYVLRTHDELTSPPNNDLHHRSITDYYTEGEPIDLVDLQDKSPILSL